MEERCILVTPEDVAYGEDSKKTCEFMSSTGKEGARASEVRRTRFGESWDWEGSVDPEPDLSSGGREDTGACLGGRFGCDKLTRTSSLWGRGRKRRDGGGELFPLLSFLPSLLPPSPSHENPLLHPHTISAHTCSSTRAKPFLVCVFVPQATSCLPSTDPRTSSIELSRSSSSDPQTVLCSSRSEQTRRSPSLRCGPTRAARIP